MSARRPFTAPKVSFPSNFPRPTNTEESLKLIKQLQIGVFSGTTRPSEFFMQLDNLPISKTKVSLAISAAITNYLLYCEPFPSSLCQLLVKPVSNILQHENEIVQRSCLSIFYILGKDLSQFCDELANSFNDLTPRAQEMLFSFAFSLDSPLLQSFVCFLPFAKECQHSDDELLAAAASDFVQCVGPLSPKITPLSPPKKSPPPKSPPRSPTHSSKDMFSDDFDDETEDEDIFGGPPQYDSPPVENSPPPIKHVSNFSTRIKVKPLVEETGKMAVSAPTFKTPRSPPREEKVTRQMTLSEAISNLSDKDWSKQQSGVDCISGMIDTNPRDVESQVKDIWLDLMKLVQQPRTILQNSTLQLSNKLFTNYSAQLAPSCPQFVTILLNLVVSSHQFIADGAMNVLVTISELAPKKRVITPLVTGTKHKNSIARGKAATCLGVVIEKNVAMDATEIGVLIKALAPLMRDAQKETRDAARTALKKLTTNDLFASVAKEQCKSSTEYRELCRLLE